MKKQTLLALTVLTSAALTLPLAAQAQQSAAGASTAHHVVKKKHAEKHTAKKPVHKKTKKGVSHKTAKAIEAETPPQTLTERLTDAQLQTAQQIYPGTFPCELGEHVTVAADEAHPGFFSVTSGKRRYYMHPVESRTGAIRMEDNRRGAVWLQLGPKSMLMDQKEGQRVADNCEAEAQKDYAAHMQDHPQSQFLNAPANAQPPQQPPAQAAPAPVSSAPAPVDSAPAPVGSAPEAPASSGALTPVSAPEAPASSDTLTPASAPEAPASSQAPAPDSAASAP
jgi:hypothetical protein